MNTLELLKDIPYFKGFDGPALESLRSKGDIINIKCGHPLIQQGDTSDQAYILLDGRLRAVLEKDGEENKMLAEIGKGEIVGEMAALFGGPRNATIIAVRNSTLLKLSREDFVELLQSQQDSLLHLSKTILKRASNSFVPNNRMSTVALIPTTPSLQLHDFCEQLLKAVRSYTSASLLTPQMVEEKPGEKDRLSHLEKLFVKHEEQHSLVLYLVASRWGDWTEACLARADKIIWIAEADESPEPSLFERRINKACMSLNHAAHELVLIHPSRQQRPTGTSQWLNKRQLSRHYHIARNFPKDVQRLARFLTGNAIGVALSGGGFRAPFQFGILHAMMEKDIPVDIIRWYFRRCFRQWWFCSG